MEFFFYLIWFDTLIWSTHMKKNVVNSVVFFGMKMKWLTIWLAFDHKGMDVLMVFFLSNIHLATYAIAPILICPRLMSFHISFIRRGHKEFWCYSKRWLNEQRMSVWVLWTVSSFVMHIIMLKINKMKQKMSQEFAYETQLRGVFLNKENRLENIQLIWFDIN